MPGFGRFDAKVAVQLPRFEGALAGVSIWCSSYSHAKANLYNDEGTLKTVAAFADEESVRYDIAVKPKF